MPTVQQKY